MRGKPFRAGLLNRGGIVTRPHRPLPRSLLLLITDEGNVMNIWKAIGRAALEGAVLGSFFAVMFLFYVVVAA